MWKTIYKFVSSKTPKKKRMMWVTVPMSCRTREEKDIIILDLINTLERQIKIN